MGLKVDVSIFKEMPSVLCLHRIQKTYMYHLYSSFYLLKGVTLGTGSLSENSGGTKINSCVHADGENKNLFNFMQIFSAVVL